MSGLEKADLQELGPGRSTKLVGKPVKVQFNPASLRLQMQNAVEGGQTQTRQAEHYLGASSATLSLELAFDTADEGTTAHPVNVRTHTARVAKFVLPQHAGTKKQTSPRVRFHWCDLIFDGVMTQFSEDLDLFSSSGVPLRAKVTISISGQDPNYESLAKGAGAATGAGAEAPGSAGGLSLGLGASASLSLGAGVALGAGLGVSLGAGISLGISAPRIGVALSGESPADFAARMGLDPAAWRAVAAPGGLSVSLSAGTELAFPDNAGAAPGVAQTSGSGEPSTAERLAGAAGPAPALSPAQAVATGFALAAAGGLDAAAQTVQQARADAASSAQLAAFAAPMPTPVPSALARAGVPDRADERAVSFGAGVPLRPRVGAPAGGRTVLGRRAPLRTPAPPMPASADCGCGCGGHP